MMASGSRPSIADSDLGLSAEGWQAKDFVRFADGLRFAHSIREYALDLQMS
jgi:hypothetical protein